MNEPYIYKWLFQKISIEKTNNGIDITRASLSKSSEFNVHFEDINPKYKIKKEMNPALLSIAGMIFVIGIMSLIFQNPELFLVCICISLVLSGIAITLKRNVILLSTITEGEIEIPFSRANEEDSKAFIQSVIDAANKYIINKYSQIDRDLPYDVQMNNLLFLKNRELIDLQEFEDLKNKLIGKNSEAKSIGFNSKD